MFKTFKKLLLIICLSIALFAVADLALAQAGPDVGLEAAEGTGLSAVNDPRVIAANIIRIILGFLGIIAVGLIIYAGWLYMTAEGEAEKIEKAKKILIGAFIGLIISLASFAIASFILSNLLEATGAGGGGGGGGGGSVTPGGGEISCDGNALEPNCQVDDSACGVGKYCNSYTCTCKNIILPGEGETCLTDLLDPQCNNGQCAVGLSCSSSDCICEKTDQPGEGENCDADPGLGGCQALDCADNLVCSVSNDCICIRTPLIAWISPMDAEQTPNGAAGNFITIGGRYFGNTPGQVIFLGDPGNASDDKIAAFPNQVNPLCANFWQDNQIIAVVPNEAVSGPIKVVDSDNYYDTTDNNRGSPIKDFLVNSIKRPGLCQVDPQRGGLDDPFNLQGSAFNLTPRSVLFGDSLSAITAGDIKNWTNTSVDAAVPNIKDGQNTVFVQINSINSNNLGFTISNDANNNPAIEYIEPDQGPAGQYITIYGRNFKTYNAQKSSVKFYLPADPSAKINADIDFNDACKNNWWHNTYIIVKVPKVDAGKLGPYKVEVTNADDKTSLPADFTITNGIAGPGLCLLEPNNGPVGWPVAADGEKFGAIQGTGRVQFFNNKDGLVNAWADEKIETNVPINSTSGPVRIIDGYGRISNSLPFRVGKCSDSSECENGEECCGGGTYWSGICRAVGTCSQGSPVACEFGWSFSTKAGDCAANQERCDIPNAPLGAPVTFNCCARGQCNSLTGQCDGCPPNKPDQCDGDLECCSTGGCVDLDGDGKTECSDAEACYNYGLSQCSSSYFCPNSPGKCSVYNPAAGAVTQTGSCDYSCNNFNVCKNDLCEYKSVLDKCALKNQTCAPPKTVDYTLGGISAKATADCLSYGGQNRWIMAVNTSCPDGWTSIPGGRCMENNTICSLCATGFECGKETADSVQGICLVKQKLCPAGSICNNDNKCVKDDSASCECCCRIGFDSQDCCSPLKCEGNCGGDRSADTDTFGNCSGCASAGATQEERNAACNCLGTSGKFCLINADNPQGICKDCAQISDASACSGQGAGSCCVDAEKNNICRGGTAPYGAGSPAYNYCAYYECNSGICPNSPVASSTLPTYSTLPECNNLCKPAAQFGNTCFNSATSTQSCDINKCIGFSCINEDGSGAAAPKCGICCCDPFAAPDSCKALNPLLVCQPDQGSCSGAERGLCCGCSKDTDCGDASAVGCGSDTCCQARPNVIETKTMPANGAIDVCRNSLIQATFDQPMQISTFKNNVIVAGEYGADQCPANTKYLTAAYKPSLLNRLVNLMVKLPVLNKIFINQAQAIPGNFCAVAGTVSGQVKADKTTVMEFKIKNVLEANRKYYVIIKGDTDFADAIHNGVLSQAGIGLKSVDEEVFNGVNFKGYVWSFTAKPKTAADEGICLVNNVGINPASYLFNTVINDPADDGGAGDETIKDSDKIFTATAYYAPGQPIVPIDGFYNWRWNWLIEDKKVVDFINENTLSEQTIAAQNVKEANTLLHAKATIIEDTVNQATTVGRFKENTAAVYVFICANPWPAFTTDISGNLIWTPWQDAPNNCTAQAGGCVNANFALYYCRDAGAAGTADDLPAILSDTAVIRGSSAEQNILKEYYFFRESTPDIGGANLATTTNDIIRQGGKAGLIWQAIPIPAGQELEKYLVYYGTKSGVYEQSIAAAEPGTALNPVIISNLTNGVKYYFAVTARYKSGGESGYSNETSFIPNDIWPPAVPLGLAGSAAISGAKLSWQANQDDAVIYKVYYGAASGSLGAAVTLAKDKCSAVTGKCELTIGNLTSGVTYYFAVTALDLKTNESAKSAEIDLIIL